MGSVSPPNRKSCISQCFWCISTCNGIRNPRVQPSDPIPVIPINAQKANFENREIVVVQNEPKKYQEETVNQFFVPDENGVVHAPRDQHASNCSEQPDFLVKNSIFIEIDKDRRYRVIHLKSKLALDSDVDNVDAVNPEASAIVHLTSKTENVEEEGEGEEEYWFSKWARKPRFRSIFEKNTKYCGADEDEGENNNSVTSNNGGTLAKDFEVARSAAAAKRRAWAYNNAGNKTEEPGIKATTLVDEDEDFNSIIVSETAQKWSKHKTEASPQNTPPTTARHSSSSSSNGGIINPAFVEDAVDLNTAEEEQEEFHEMAVDCPPDFVSPVKSLSLKRGTPSPNPSNSSTIGKNKSVKRETGTSSGTPPDPCSPQPLPKTTNKTPIIFFIHGISGSCDIWKSQIEYFHNLGYEVVAPDLLGHGFSSTPSNSKLYVFESVAQDLMSVYDYFVDEERKAVIIGHGYGACLAAVVSRVRPKSCCIYVSIAGGGPTPLVNRSCCSGTFLPIYCKLFHGHRYSARFDDPELRHVLPANIRENVLNGQVWGDGDSTFYRRITIPTLLVYGMKDKVVNLVEVCEMERTIPKSFLEVIDAAGHQVMVEEPAKLNKMLGKFIQSWI